MRLVRKMLPGPEEDAEAQAGAQGEDHPVRRVQEGVQGKVPVGEPQEDQTPQKRPLLQLPPLREEISPEEPPSDTHRERPPEQIQVPLRQVRQGVQLSVRNRSSLQERTRRTEIRLPALQ